MRIRFVQFFIRFILISCMIGISNVQSAQHDVDKNIYTKNIQHYTKLIKNDPNNYILYMKRGMAIYKEADQWDTLEAFEAHYPGTSQQLAKMLFMIDQGKGAEEFKEFQEYKNLKTFYFAFKKAVKDFEHALNLNHEEAGKIQLSFIKDNPIYWKMLEAFFGTPKR